jgi:pimeloyl-ACP methyl ester carboxylesterase
MCDTPAYRIAARELADYMTTGSWESDFVGPRLARVTPVLPTFVVWGMDDNVLPVDEAHKIHAMLPVSTLALVGGARHDVDLDRPDLFHLLLLDVLRGQVGASTLDDVILIQ